MSGPSMAVIERMSLAQDSPKYGHDPRAEGLVDRVLALVPQSWEDVPAADREFLDECVLDVENGHGIGISDPASWPGDWQATDEALELREDGELAEDTRARAPRLAADDDDDDDVPEGKALDFDEDGWVGL